ncbi:Gfo/Idh/MocA family protein [Streptomyces camelliae]|uniref:Gfo/Idh/MocA family oxidoreductase n=1 Tax=Streptomyces camelliae TaxID=3004093 RepID=A0ABY7P8G8_9ACTN|nr:Gfo/Idh/MocA family oxidoreductase [Streptomyces sp. HUAS 2-6]WBO65126.1 Gfo/Idh/MocA family oxidoreductase [Streptomyces sp. HUAS 2-6]
MTLGVAIVGFGVAGRQHAAALDGVPFARVATVLERDGSVDTDGLPRSADWAGLLDDPSVDLVALCVPPGNRAALAEEAVRAGKAVLLEKPPASSPAEIDRIVALGRRLGRPIGVMLQERLRLPEHVLGWDWGKGATGVLQVSRYRPSAHYRWAGWRHDPAESLGGVAAHLAVDYLDLACQLLGEPVNLRLGGSRELVPGIDSRIAGLVEFREGAVLSFVVTAESTVRSQRLEILGTDRRIVVADSAVTTEAAGRIEDHPAPPTPQLRRAVYQEMARALDTGGLLPRSGLRSARHVSVILRSVFDELNAVRP